MIYSTKSNISIIEEESVVNLNCSEIENNNFGQTESADCNEHEEYPEITFENTDPPIDKIHAADCVPKEIFKKPYGLRGNKDKIIQEIKKGREERLAMMREMKEAEHNNPIQIFFKSMASTVMNFPPELVVETRMRVNNIVSEMELRALKAKVSSQTTSHNPEITTFSNTSEIMEDLSTSNSNISNISNFSTPSPSPNSEAMTTTSDFLSTSQNPSSTFAYLNYINDMNSN